MESIDLVDLVQRNSSEKENEIEDSPHQSGSSSSLSLFICCCQGNLYRGLTHSFIRLKCKSLCVKAQFLFFTFHSGYSIKWPPEARKIQQNTDICKIWRFLVPQFMDFSVRSAGKTRSLWTVTKLLLCGHLQLGKIGKLSLFFLLLFSHAASNLERREKRRR